MLECAVAYLAPFQARQFSHFKIYIQTEFLFCQSNINPPVATMISYASTVFAFLFLSSCPSLAFPGLKLRELCYETDTLLSFQLWIDDSTPFCSSLLSISDFTSFVGPTKYLTYAQSTQVFCRRYLRVAELPSRRLQRLATIRSKLSPSLQLQRSPR